MLGDRYDVDGVCQKLLGTAGVRDRFLIGQVLLVAHISLSSARLFLGVTEARIASQSHVAVYADTFFRRGSSLE